MGISPKNDRLSKPIGTETVNTVSLLVTAYDIVVTVIFVSFAVLPKCSSCPGVSPQLRFLHKGFPNTERTLVSSEFLGEHFALLRLAVYHIQHIHRTVANVGNQINAFQRSCKACNSGISLRINANIINIEVVIYLFVGELYFCVFH